MNPIRYNCIDVSYPFRLRGPSHQQDDVGLLWPPPQYRQTRGLAGGIIEPTTALVFNEGLQVGYVGLHNRSGSTVVAGIGVRLQNRMWVAGQWVDAAGTPFTDDTVDAQSTTVTDFPLETATVNDGFVVASSVPFNALSIDIGTASTGPSAPVRAMRYSNTTGDGWTNFGTNTFVFDAAATHYNATATTVANESLIVWAPPADWGRITGTGLNGVPAGLYAVNIRATTAPSVAAVADSMTVCRLYLVTEALADNAVLEAAPGSMAFFMEPGGDALVALFGTADPGNRVTALVRTY